MCRALRVLCAAGDADRLAALKRAAVSTGWELVGGAASTQELPAEIERWTPDVVVVDGSLGADAVRAARAGRRLRVVAVGGLDGADAVAESLEEVRSAILGVPGPGGPVRA